MTTWTQTSDGTTNWDLIELRYSTWDYGTSRWDTDLTESIWDFAGATTYVTEAGGTTVWS